MSTTPSESGRAAGRLTTIADLEGADPVVRDEVADRAGAVESASVALRAALDDLHQVEDEAWRRYASELEEATLRLDAALSVASSRLRAEKADTPEELEDALEELATTWRSRADEIRVQTHLGVLDARDAGLHVLDDLDAAGHRITETLTAVRSDAEHSFSSLRERVQHTIDDVGRAVQDFGRGLRMP
jgi:hypothetical protein